VKEEGCATVVTFNPEWAARNPEKAKERVTAFYERQQQAEERSIQNAKALAKKYGIDEQEIM
jgi:NH3-dependent NAD+ synthetase